MFEVKMPSEKLINVNTLSEAEFNEELEGEPELVNKDPYGKGWIVKIKISDETELDGLLNADAYKAII